jgi:CHAD domain-containing protein
MRTDDAMLVLLRHYRAIMDLNIPGMVEDLDTEFLHDFRVGLRRSRALLRRVPGVFAPARLAPFVDDLRWLGQVTSPPRDADVHALEFPAYIAALPAAQEAALAPLMARVGEERRIAHRDLVAALSSARMRRRWAAWGRFLDTQPPRSSRQSRARQPIAACALERTMRAARRVRREGRQIGAESPPAEYHELRKSCKNLRYLIDAFGEILPIKNLSKVTQRLKKLQDVLGEHQDLDVHRDAILRLHRALADDGVLPGETHDAMEHLVEELARRAARARGHFEAEFRGFLEVSLDRRLRRAAQ